MLLRGDGRSVEVKYTYSVDAGGERDFEEIHEIALSLPNPARAMPLPMEKEDYGTTGELFARVQQAIEERTHISNKQSALLTFWVFSTWFQNVLTVLPCLAITGRAQEGEAILRTLQAYSYHPHLLAGLNSQSLKVIQWGCDPTLLISEPNLGRRMAVFLGCSTSRGYLAMKQDGHTYDYFGPKAVYLGEDPPIRSMLQNCLHIEASAKLKVGPNPVPMQSKEARQSLQNQLLQYRIRNLRSVFKSDFNMSAMSPESNAVASALGRCIVDAPELQAQLESLLTPYSRQEMAERLDDLGTLVVGAAFNLCHTEKTQILVGEIAHEVNRVLRDRGERLQFSAEKVGHKLKKLGLLTRRLGGRQWIPAGSYDPGPSSRDRSNVRI